MNTNIFYSYLETSGGQSSNPYLNVVHEQLLRQNPSPKNYKQKL